MSSLEQPELLPKMKSPRSGRHAFDGPYGPGARAAVHGPLVVQGHRCSVILTEEQWESFIQTGKLKKQWFGNGKSIPVKDSLNQKNTHKKIKNQTTNKQQHNKKQKLKQNSKHKQTTNTTTNKNTQKKMRRTLLMRPSKASTKMEDPQHRHFKRCYSTFLWLLIMIGCMRVSWCAAGVWADIASMPTSLFQRSTRILLTTASSKKLSCQSASQEEAKLSEC